MKKETIYTLPYHTESEIKAAKELRNELYQRHNCVQIYHNGLHEVRVVATEEKPMANEQIGVKLSRDLKWSGVDIMLVAQAALTDANFHTEAAAIEQMINAALA